MKILKGGYAKEILYTDKHGIPNTTLDESIVTFIAIDRTFMEASEGFV